MANKYRSVLASGGVQPTGNAQPADVLSGKTFSNADGIDKTGTMVNRGAVSGTATPSQPYTIPAGYHNGSGVVTADVSVSATFGSFSGGTYTAPIGTKVICGVLISNGSMNVPTAINGTVTVDNNGAIYNVEGIFFHVDVTDSSQACTITDVANSGVAVAWAIK